MPKPMPASAAFVNSADDVEAAFYEALRLGDLAQLMACWAVDEDIVWVSANQARLVGRAAIEQRFARLLARQAQRVHEQQIHRVEGLGCAVHSVIERIELNQGDGVTHRWMIATNVYHRTRDGWRLVLHHASPANAAQAERAEPPADTTVH